MWVGIGFRFFGVLSRFCDFGVVSSDFGCLWCVEFALSWVMPSLRFCGTGLILSGLGFRGFGVGFADFCWVDTVVWFGVLGAPGF